MKVILTVLFSNLSKKPFRNLYLGICFMLCSGFLLSAFVLNCSMDRSFDKTYAKLDAPQLTATIGESEVTEEKLEEFLENTVYIRQYSVSKYYLANRVELKEDEMDFAYLISSQDTEVDYGCVIAMVKILLLFPQVWGKGFRILIFIPWITGYRVVLPSYCRRFFLSFLYSVLYFVSSCPAW